jgi:hypothetical protein
MSHLKPHILFTEDSFHYYPTNEGLPREFFPSRFYTKLSDAGPFSTMRATWSALSYYFNCPITTTRDNLKRHCSCIVSSLGLIHSKGMYLPQFQIWHCKFQACSTLLYTNTSSHFVAFEWQNRRCTTMNVYQQMAGRCSDNTLCVAITTNTRRHWSNVSGLVVVGIANAAKYTDKNEGFRGFPDSPKANVESVITSRPVPNLLHLTAILSIDAVSLFRHYHYNERMCGSESFTQSV